MIKEKHRRFLSVLLLLALCAGLLPHTAFAAEETCQFETLEYLSRVSDRFVGDSCYYTDGWFSAEAGERNDSLALISAQLSAVSPDGERCAALLKKLGFADAAPMRYDSADGSDCAYTIGTKPISVNGADVTLTAVAFQSSLYGDEGWQQNVTVDLAGKTMQDQASYAAAAQAFLADYEKTAPEGDVIFWITGLSRGGAVANLAAAYLLDRDPQTVVFGYTFEAPATTMNASAQDPKYAGIQNYICDDDPVTMLPIWGMTRYGTEIVYNTVSPADLQEALTRQNPDAAALAENYHAEAFGGDVKAYAENLLAKLAAVVPAREDYSRVRTVSIPGSGSVSYSYQNGLQALCHIIFGGTGSASLSLSALLDYLPDLAYAGLEEACAVVKAPENGAALLADATRLRWDLAGALKQMLSDSAAEVQQSDLYALLLLLSPLVVDVGAVAEEDWTLPEYEEFADSEYRDYLDLSLALSIAEYGSTLVFSHYPDGFIARLKLLAPAPAAEDVALTIAPPAAGDEVSLTPDAVTEAFGALERPGMRIARVGWDTEDAVLKSSKVYHLEATLAVIGQSIPEDFRFLINGEEPAERTVEYVNGEIHITGIWAYSPKSEQLSASTAPVSNPLIGLLNPAKKEPGIPA